MKRPIRPLMVVLPVTLTLVISLAYQARALGDKVSEPGNRHNLSSSNTIPGFLYKATSDATNIRGQQICIFCHTPHSANVVGQAPLWNRNFSAQNFQRYTSTTLQIRHIGAAQYGVGAQPNGSSKLCLSCHDGVSRLGAVYNGAEIAMVKDVIDGLASFNPSTNKMLTGHHPVSFVYLTGFNSGSQTGSVLSALPAKYRFMPQSSAGKVKLFDTNRNSNGWMQCTTCHDPHQNQSIETGPGTCYDSGGLPGACDTSTYTRKVAPFWVYHGTNTTATQDTSTVCKVCHALAASGTPSWP